MKKLVFCLITALLLCACSTDISPTGRHQVFGGVSQRQLDQLGEQAFSQTKAKEKISGNVRQNAYVRCVVDALVAELPLQWRQTKWETALFINDEPNAFALPGGKVGVNTGIFRAAKNQEQLAAVLGHEIGHVVSRHHEERITWQLGTQAGLGLLGVLAGTAYGDSAATAVNQIGGLTAQAAFLLPGSRTQEREADVVGQRLMAQAGFDPVEAVHLWKNMLAIAGQRAPQWLSTHPDPTNRIRQLEQQSTILASVYAQARESGRVPHCSPTA
ncbi:M48 family metallopeptidase [Xylella taiwanensis]|uniref:Peptidase n=1 Tax=Xylella taiwanensis TaxID=1444770 RepID=Z9JM81_9GAMM|nr:M48 family metallopeptidase [Xylella taiwanensis]AXI82479.1 peptidase [Xylella taiwanensis]EWS79284.1 peptidase [Xylella taiwanensis]MCD8455470.1 M48 family metallopeptidase [Xylella taiwanensis]MCD8457875.1 M48 family metallopeptidase [Xylella taiwanensis]MCD8460010.1 M48 family metallopeptidase [Xylella taiwanensis]